MFCVIWYSFLAIWSVGGRWDLFYTPVHCCTPFSTMYTSSVQLYSTVYPYPATITVSLPAGRTAGHSGQYHLLPSANSTQVHS